MKLLFENWRKIVEQELDPKSKYFGDNPEELQCVTNMRSPEAAAEVSRDSFTVCMQDSGYELLGHGSFRSAFTIPGRDDIIIKFISPRLIKGGESLVSRAKKMNEREATGGFQTSSKLVVRVYDAADDFLWIKSEKVTPIKSWVDMMSYFPLLKRTMKNMNVPKIFPSLLRRDPHKGLAGIYQDPLLIEIIDLLKKFDAPTWDIRPNNVGYVTRDGEKQFVILDPGFGLPSDDLNDAMRRGEVPIPQELRGDEEELRDPHAITKTHAEPRGRATKIAKPGVPRPKNVTTKLMETKFNES